jgi:hypothetical protein
MYQWIWLRLPGGPSTRAVELALVLLAVTALLWLVVFPWASLHLPVDQAGIG